MPVQIPPRSHYGNRSGFSCYVLAAPRQGHTGREKRIELPVERYRDWHGQPQPLTQFSVPHDDTATRLLRLAGIADQRTGRSISALARLPLAADAVQIADRVVARALTQRLTGTTAPKWRPFKLALILVDPPEIADPRGCHGSPVDIVFLPTGGGKTEACLGPGAFTTFIAGCGIRPSRACIR